MKRYSMSFADSLTHRPAAPERTARRSCGADGSMNFDVEYQVWPSRGAMLTTIELQGRSEPNRRHWKAVAAVQP